MKQKNNSFKSFSYTLVLLVFSAISSFFVSNVIAAAENSSNNLIIHQTLPLDAESSGENQIVPEESFGEEEDQFVNTYLDINLRANGHYPHCLQTYLLIISRSHDILIPPPKSA